MIPGYYTPQRDMWDDWLRNSSNRVHLVSKLLKIPGIPDNEYSMLFDMIYSGDIELFNLAEKIITKKEMDYEKTKCSKIENEEQKQEKEL